MADFAFLGEAVCRTIQWAESFATAYQRLRMDAIEDSLESSPAIERLRRVVDERDEFSGTIGRLWSLIKPEKFEDGWPRSERGFGNLLRAHATALREVGYEVDFPPRKQEGRQVSIYKIPEQRAQRTQRASDPVVSEVSSTGDGIKRMVF